VHAAPRACGHLDARLLARPDGKPGGAQAGAVPEQSGRLWVPEGARGIQVTLEPGGVQNFAAEREEIVIQ
jgi:hypothetical protein